MTDIDTAPATRTLHVEGSPPRRRLRTYRLAIRHADGRLEDQDVDAPRLRLGSREGNGIVIKDDAMSRTHLEILADEHGYRVRDLSSTNGTFVDGYRIHDIYLRPGSVVKFGNTEMTFTPLDVERDVPASTASRFGCLVGRSLPMRELFALLERIAPTDATVLIEGESGTGKEVVAQALHEQSSRSTGPLVVFDCAAVPANLIESELFGHEKGAFTGARDRRIGRLEEADGGTLFIDELGELPLDLQPKLLRALEKREVRRVGGTATIPVDIRIIAATNRDLAREVNRGAFREDLYYRLAVVRVELPPLRERRDDIPLLVEHFVSRGLDSDPRKAAALLSSISDANWRRLGQHPWPGNIRELRNVIERTLALSASGPVAGVEPPTLRSAIGSSSPPQSSSAIDFDRPFGEQKADVVAKFEETYLKGQLEHHGGNISRAAAASGIDRMYFKRLLKKYP